VPARCYSVEYIVAKLREHEKCPGSSFRTRWPEIGWAPLPVGWPEVGRQWDLEPRWFPASGVG